MRGRKPTTTDRHAGTRQCSICRAIKPLFGYSGRNSACKPCNLDKSWLAQMDKRTPNEIIAQILADARMIQRRRQYLLDKYNINVPTQAEEPHP